MTFTQQNQTPDLQEDEATLYPLSPSSQSIHNSIISLTIFIVAELETQIDECRAAKIIREVFLPLNFRFSSIIDKDEKGSPCWKKVEVHVDDHIRVPTFPKGLTTMEYDKKLKEYLATVASDALPQDRPLWEFHVVKYPSTNGAASVVLKISHAIGDGYSLINALFQTFRRADNPSLPLTLPTMSTSAIGEKKSFSGYVTMFVNTISDLTFTILKGSVLEDSENTIRSATPGVEFEPIAITAMSTSLERLKMVKSRVGGTLNDVITGAIYYAIHLYIARKGDMSEERKMNLMVMFNTRMLRYKNIDEMIKANIWGNNVSFLLAGIPCIGDDGKVDPLSFITKAKEIMERKKNSMLPYLTNTLINALRWIRGPKGVSEFLHASYRNTTTSISNLVGPKEKMAMAGHPIGSCYFFVTGIPQSLIFTVWSHTGQLRVTVTMEKKLINSQVLESCMEEAFGKIYDAAADSSGGGVH